MTADAHPVTAHGRFAPDPIPLARSVDEQPTAPGIAAPPELAALFCQGQRRGQEIVDDAVPTARCRSHRAVRTKPVVDPLKGLIHRASPRGGVECRIVGKGADRVTHRPKSRQLTRGRRAPGSRDGVRGQELDGTFRCIEVVVRRFAVASSATIVGSRPVEAVRQPERGVRSELPCNGVHRR